MTDLKCIYCAESGITNTDVFIEIVDVELGAGWICKECFIESEKEKDEHLKELEEQLKAKEQECEELKTDKIFLEAHINDLTSPVNVEDCEHSVHNGEYIACSYYGGCRCDDLDFANCMFRENARLKEQDRKSVV